MIFRTTSAKFEQDIFPPFREMMRSINATEAIVTFDGSGDSGWASLYGVKIKNKIWTFSQDPSPETKTLLEPAFEGMFESEEWVTGVGWVKGTKLSTRTLSDVCGLIFNHYMGRYGGWENNNGANGEVLITVDKVVTKYQDKLRYTGSTGRSAPRRPKVSSRADVREYEVLPSAMTMLTDKLTEEAK